MPQSFRGVNFREMGDEYPSPEAEAIVNEIHYPGGDRNAVQLLGRTARKGQVKALCTLAEYNALQAQVGRVGTLSIGYGPINAVLKKVAGTERIDEGNGDRWWFATLDYTEVS